MVVDGDGVLVGGDRVVLVGCRVVVVMGRLVVVVGRLVVVGRVVVSVVPWWWAAYANESMLKSAIAKETTIGTMKAPVPISRFSVARFASSSSANAAVISGLSSTTAWAPET